MTRARDTRPIAVGMEVEWTDGSQRGRTVALRLRDGVVEALDGAWAMVRTPGRRRTRVPVGALRPKGSRSALDEYMDLARQAAPDD